MEGLYWNGYNFFWSKAWPEDAAGFTDAYHKKIAEVYPTAIPVTNRREVHNALSVVNGGAQHIRPSRVYKMPIGTSVSVGIENSRNMCTVIFLPPKEESKPLTLSMLRKMADMSLTAQPVAFVDRDEIQAIKKELALIKPDPDHRKEILYRSIEDLHPLKQEQFGFKNTFCFIYEGISYTLIEKS